MIFRLSTTLRLCRRANTVNTRLTGWPIAQLTNAKKNMAESGVAGNAKKMAEDAVKAAAKQATGNASLEAELAAKKAAEAKLKAARVAEQKAQAEAKVQAEKAAEQFRAQQQAQAAQQGAHSRAGMSEDKLSENVKAPKADWSKRKRRLGT